MELIECKDLCKTYGTGDLEVRALDGASFSVEKGEFVVILGPSGAGKSTLLNLLGGMDTATSGTLRVGEKTVTALSEKELSAYRRKDIGFVFQFYNLMANLTALENVELAQGETGMTAEEALSLVGLEKRKNNFPPQLSGGEQQRVAIARAIVKNPLLLLCDEPTGALDSKTGRAILGLLSDLCRKEGMTVIVVTHNAELGKLADRLIRVNDGKIMENALQTAASPEDITW